MERLIKCYYKVAKILGDDAEHLKVVQNVELHRRFWKPAKVRVLLLAESHVYTHLSDCVSMRDRHLISPSDTPEPFVRLVYCLGYGEPDFVGHNVSENNGTWQFWKIFASCLAPPSSPTTFRPVLKGGNPDYKSRIYSKAAVLNGLRKKGVWLLDASILALYSPGGKKPDSSTREKILLTCWDEYIGYLMDESKPEKLIVIGKGVNSVLHDRIREIFGRPHIALPQPQKRMSSEELSQIHETYYAVCNGLSSR